MTLVYSPRYAIDIGRHVFPTRKYQLVRDRFPELAVIEPEPATWEQLALVHTPEYLAKLRDGTMTAEDVAQLELPWSPEMVDGFRTMVGGTMRSAIDTLQSGGAGVQSAVAVHIGGGLHHAFANHGEGFCPFNDVAVATRALQPVSTDRPATGKSKPASPRGSAPPPA